MAGAPKWRDIPKYPVIAGVATLAVVVTIAWAARWISRPCTKVQRFVVASCGDW